MVLAQVNTNAPLPPPTAEMTAPAQESVARLNLEVLANLTPIAL
jgi:hypothetical protein